MSDDEEKRVIASAVRSIAMRVTELQARIDRALGFIRESYKGDVVLENVRRAERALTGEGET